MGNTATVEASSDAEIVTVDTATESPSATQNSLLSKLEHMPQLQQAARNKVGEDQVWRDLATYSQEQLQMDPQWILGMLNVYKAWNRNQGNTVVQQQDFVNKRIEDIDKLATEVLEESRRRQQILDNIPAVMKTLTASQSQVELLVDRLAKCREAIQAASSFAHANCNDEQTNAVS